MNEWIEKSFIHSKALLQILYILYKYLHKFLYFVAERMGGERQ